MSIVSNAITNAGKSISRHAGLLGLKIHANSPQLLVVAGVVTLAGGVVAACVASRKVDKVLDEHKDAMVNVDEQTEMEEEQNEQSRDSEDAKAARKTAIQKAAKKDKVVVYFRTGLKFVKLYLPAVCLIGLGVTCFLSSNNILSKRNVALSSAFTALTQELNDYRGRVAARVGKDVEKELYYNLDSTTSETKSKDENGNTVSTKETEYSNSGKMPGGMYTRYFTPETSKLWKTNQLYNRNFLEIQQKYCDDLLKSRGYLFLNEVYDALGIAICDYGQIAGWIYDPHNEKRVGGPDCNYVDFRITEVYEKLDVDCDPDEPRRKFFMIDPNVEGNILNLI